MSGVRETAPVTDLAGAHRVCWRVYTGAQSYPVLPPTSLISGGLGVQEGVRSHTSREGYSSVLLGSLGM